MLIFILFFLQNTTAQILIADNNRITIVEGTEIYIAESVKQINPEKCEFNKNDKNQKTRKSSGNNEIRIVNTSLSDTKSTNGNYKFIAIPWTGQESVGKTESRAMSARPNNIFKAPAAVKSSGLVFDDSLSKLISRLSASKNILIAYYERHTRRPPPKG
ncbi:MAG: hypothetical protein LBR64_02750 [Dysgonamonadaceae bacterium]|nr:hypothetical protein [Dysgonamonadaceae bacterium]